MAVAEQQSNSVYQDAVRLIQQSGAPITTKNLGLAMNMIVEQPQLRAQLGDPSEPMRGALSELGFQSQEDKTGGGSIARAITRTSGTASPTTPAPTPSAQPVAQGGPSPTPAVVPPPAQVQSQSTPAGVSAPSALQLQGTGGGSQVSGPSAAGVSPVAGMQVNGDGSSVSVDSPISGGEAGLLGGGVLGLLLKRFIGQTDPVIASKGAAPPGANIAGVGTAGAPPPPAASAQPVQATAAIPPDPKAPPTSPVEAAIAKTMPPEAARAGVLSTSPAEIPAAASGVKPVLDMAAGLDQGKLMSMVSKILPSVMKGQTFPPGMIPGADKATGGVLPDGPLFSNPVQPPAKPTPLDMSINRTVSPDVPGMSINAAQPPVVEPPVPIDMTPREKPPMPKGMKVEGRATEPRQLPAPEKKGINLDVAGGDISPTKTVPPLDAKGAQLEEMLRKGPPKPATPAHAPHLNMGEFALEAAKVLSKLKLK